MDNYSHRRYQDTSFYIPTESTTQSYVENIVFPKSGAIRTRKVVSRSNARPTGKYPSWKAGRMVQWESTHELHAFRLLDCDPDVVGFREQPCEIEYEIDGVRHRHYPDILVEFKERKELWEVKPEGDAVNDDTKVRTTLLVNELPAWGYLYKMVYGIELARQPRLNNAGYLLRWGRRPISDLDREAARRLLTRTGVMTLCCDSNGGFGARERKIACRLALEGVLDVDMDTPIMPSTAFRLRKGRL